MICRYVDKRVARRRIGVLYAVNYQAVHMVTNTWNDAELRTAAGVDTDRAQWGDRTISDYRCCDGILSHAIKCIICETAKRYHPGRKRIGCSRSE